MKPKTKANVTKLLNDTLDKLSRSYDSDLDKVATILPELIMVSIAFNCLSQDEELTKPHKKCAFIHKMHILIKKLEKCLVVSKIVRTFASSNKNNY